MILRTLAPILRTAKAATGTKTSAISREQGIAQDHDDDQTDEGQQVAPARRDDEVERGARRLADERLAGDEFGRMALGVRGDLHPQHLVEDALLDVGDDGVGDSRQRHLIAVGRQALDGVDDDDRQGDAPDGGDVLVDEDVVDDAADDPRRQRRGQRDDAEHRERQRVALPMLEALVGQQPLEQAAAGASK
jgi:hypothetical protein